MVPCTLSSFYSVFTKTEEEESASGEPTTGPRIPSVGVHLETVHEPGSLQEGDGQPRFLEERFSENVVGFRERGRPAGEALCQDLVARGGCRVVRAIEEEVLNG